ncbi:RNA polymerase-associated protein [Labeo rohita]|uniref:RNA polymerase-associated protein n=1 Tax=Labeo rohita TaxID=84645 RepID=A0ABQ8L0J4_LABRO|nr:RNA polymerase-associated protein [Labeo rohita]
MYPSTSTFDASEALSPISAVTCHTHCSPSAHHLPCRFTSGLPVSSSTQILDSTSALQPIASALAPSSPSPQWPVIARASVGSLVPPVPPWLVVDHPPPQDSTPLSSPRPSISLALSGFSFPLALPSSSVTLAPPQTSGTTSSPQSLESAAMPWTSGSLEK